LSFFEHLNYSKFEDDIFLNIEFNNKHQRIITSNKHGFSSTSPISNPVDDTFETLPMTNMLVFTTKTNSSISERVEETL